MPGARFKIDSKSRPVGPSNLEKYLIVLKLQMLHTQPLFIEIFTLSLGSKMH